MVGLSWAESLTEHSLVRDRHGRNVLGWEVIGAFFGVEQGLLAVLLSSSSSSLSLFFVPRPRLSHRIARGSKPVLDLDLESLVP